ncbi:MAG TPA: outer membrane beta-barrel protein [Agriterribacter sp.]|nr:outer membrane beta-barrel protein [Agriterribacter sp.]
MLRKFLTLSTIIVASFSIAYAQDSTVAATPEPEKLSLNVTGSVDGYYRYNFANAKKLGETNNYTSFTNSQNSFELGMASVKFDASMGKAGAVVDLGFGNRASEFSYNEDGALAAIKQAYVTYAPSDVVKFTMGKWATHVGYELLDPQLNRNYSMSYMFSYGPFSHTGIKADFSLGKGFGVMVGVANPTDMLTASFNKKYVLAQVSKTSDNFSAFLNYVGGKDMDDISNNQIGLTILGKISDKFSVGYDGTVKSYKPSGEDSYSWWGSAIYLNVDPSDKFGFTVRGEYFDDKDGGAGFGTSLFDATLSLNIKPTANFMIVPEFRLDSAKDPLFYKNSDGEGDPTSKGTGSFILAAIFSF